MIWCVEHDDKALDYGGPPAYCRAAARMGTVGECDLVEALLIVKQDGDWPVWAISKMYEVSDLKDFPSALLDALASVGDGQ